MVLAASVIYVLIRNSKVIVKTKSVVIMPIEGREGELSRVAFGRDVAAVVEVVVFIKQARRAIYSFGRERQDGAVKRRSPLFVREWKGALRVVERI